MEYFIFLSLVVLGIDAAVPCPLILTVVCDSHECGDTIQLKYILTLLHQYIQDPRAGICTLSTNDPVRDDSCYGSDKGTGTFFINGFCDGGIPDNITFTNNTGLPSNYRLPVCTSARGVQYGHDRCDGKETLQFWKGPITTETPRHDESNVFQWWWILVGVGGLAASSLLAFVVYKKLTMNNQISDTSSTDGFADFVDVSFDEAPNSVPPAGT